ncbi:MAG: hypothetical protein II943_11945 [Victivallales bacterium]|nr:hypothetical protein [Victivallales bacterium]
MQDQSPRSPADHRKAGRGFIVLANSLKMNEYHVTVEEVVVHTTQVKAATPEEAFETAAAFFEDGEFEGDPGECQEARVAVRTPSGETLIDFQKL